MINKVTLEQEKEICKLYLGGLSYQKIVNEVGFSLGTIHRVIKKNNIKVRPFHKLSIQQKNKIAQEYKLGRTLRHLAETYDVCPNNIRSLLITRKIKIRTATESKRIQYPLITSKSNITAVPTILFQGKIN